MRRQRYKDAGLKSELEIGIYYLYILHCEAHCNNSLLQYYFAKKFVALFYNELGQGPKGNIFCNESLQKQAIINKQSLKI